MRRNSLFKPLVNRGRPLLGCRCPRHARFDPFPPPSDHGTSGRVKLGFALPPPTAEPGPPAAGGTPNWSHGEAWRVEGAAACALAGDRPLSLGSHWRADGQPKTSYASEPEARAMADERRQDTGVALNVYRCDFCASWHMGNDNGRPR